MNLCNRCRAMLLFKMREHVLDTTFSVLGGALLQSCLDAARHLNGCVRFHLGAGKFFDEAGGDISSRRHALRCQGPAHLSDAVGCWRVQWCRRATLALSCIQPAEFGIPSHRLYPPGQQQFIQNTCSHFRHLTTHAFSNTSATTLAL